MLAVALHAFIPIAGMAAYGVKTWAGHRHQAQHETAPHGAHEFHAHTDGAQHGAHDTRRGPNSFCVGDCPCCTVNYKFVPVATVRPVWNLANTPDWTISTPAVPPATYHPAQAHLARAPPV